MPSTSSSMATCQILRQRKNHRYEYATNSIVHDRLLTIDSSNIKYIKKNMIEINRAYIKWEYYFESPVNNNREVVTNITFMLYNYLLAIVLLLCTNI